MTPTDDWARSRHAPPGSPLPEATLGLALYHAIATLWASVTSWRGAARPARSIGAGHSQLQGYSWRKPILTRHDLRAYGLGTAMQWPFGDRRIVQHDGRSGMPTRELNQLVSALKTLEEQPRPQADRDWTEMVEEWREDVRRLLDEMRGHVKLLLQGDPPLLTWEPLEVAIKEGETPLYKAPAARVIGPQGRFVEIVPKARQVFNAMGRVDLVSRKGRAILARFSPG